MNFIGVYYSQADASDMNHCLAGIEAAMPVVFMEADMLMHALTDALENFLEIEDRDKTECFAMGAGKNIDHRVLAAVLLSVTWKDEKMIRVVVEDERSLCSYDLLDYRDFADTK